MQSFDKNTSGLTAEEESELLAFLLEDEPLAPTAAAMLPHHDIAHNNKLSFGQQQLWFSEQLYGKSAAYNVPYSILFKGHLHLDFLSHSIQMVIDRHIILRSVLIEHNDQTDQEIRVPFAFALPYNDLRILPVTQRDSRIQEIGTQDAQQAFDLHQGPLLRATLLQIEDDAWLLLLTFHHSIFDGWSESIFFRELEHYYQAQYAQHEPTLPPLLIQYPDYAHWQYEQSAQGQYEEHQDYWVNQLRNAPQIIDLSPDYPRPTLSNLAGDIVAVYIDASRTSQLKQLAQQEHCSLFMVILAAWFCLLYRYSGQDDLLVGTPIAGRTLTEVEPLIGYFITTLALRLQVQGSNTFIDVLRQVQSVTLQAYEHQELPFEQALRQARTSSEIHQVPRLQTAVVLQNTPLHQLQLPELEVTWKWRHTHTAKFDLMLDITENKDGLAGKVEYSSELFSQQRIERLIGHLSVLLQAIATDPHQPIESLPLLTAAERQQLLVVWNQTHITYPHIPTTLHAGFEAQAAHVPHLKALIYENQQLTYQQLNTRANQLAHHLRAVGIGPETPVGIFMERSFEQIIALLAVLKAGGAYVPLDPTYPRERLSFMLEDTQVPFVLSLSSLQQALPSCQSQILSVDLLTDQLAAMPDTNLESYTHGSSLLYILYTSGSTGRPKGVMGTHQATLNRLAWMWNTYPFAPEDVCCQKTSLNFVDSVWEIWGPLLRGIPLVLIPDDVLHEPMHFLKTLAEQHVTHIVLVPSFLRALLEVSEKLEALVPKLKLCITSGEALSTDLAHQFFTQLPNRILLNLYGSSEVAADVTFHEVSPQDTASHIPLGRPIANTQVYVLNTQLQPTPMGIPGEIYIGGSGLARGYFGHKNLTNERFISNSFSSEPHARLYRTGDRGYFKANGVLYYLGRLDHQIKIRGMRIELGEIETVLAEHPSVDQCIIADYTIASGQKKIAAYLIGHTINSGILADIQSYIRQRLPAYMIPTTFVILDQMPLTANGKIDRQALPHPQAGPHHKDSQDSWRSTFSTSYVPARNEVERQLISVWEELLGVAPIGIYDRFDELGGDSLLLLQVISRQYNLFKVRLPVRDFLLNPSVDAVARWIDQQLAQLFDPDLTALLEALEQAD